MEDSLTDSLDTFDKLAAHPSLNNIVFSDDATKSYKFNTKDFVEKRFIDSSKNIVKQYFHRETSNMLAVKFITIPQGTQMDPRKEKIIKEIIHEINMLRRLQESPYIVDFYGFSLIEGNVLIFMELMRMSLKEFYLKMHKDVSFFPEGLIGNSEASSLLAKVHFIPKLQKKSTIVWLGGKLHF
jgi:serine/threonine protein kinase